MAPKKQKKKPAKKELKKGKKGSEEGEDMEVVIEESKKFQDNPVKEKIMESWTPKTRIGKLVKAGEITDIDQILDSGETILEDEIVDILLPNLKSELLLLGQAKGKFGGGQRRVFRQTQKKTREGNKPSFATYAVVGDGGGYVGIGFGKARETVPAREKAFRNAKLNILRIRRGCGSWECNCGNPHSIPAKVIGREGSVKVTLMPAPKGTGLCVESEIAKILAMAGIRDVWSKLEGHTSTRTNVLKATYDALKQLASLKFKEDHKKTLGLIEGKIIKNEMKEENE